MRFNPLDPDGASPAPAPAPVTPKAASKKKAKEPVVPPAMPLNIFRFLAKQEGVTFTDEEKALREFTLHHHTHGGDVQKLLTTWLPQFKNLAPAVPTTADEVVVETSSSKGKLPTIERPLPDEVKYAAICACLTSVEFHSNHFRLLERAAEGHDPARVAYEVVGQGGSTAPVWWSTEGKGIVVTLSDEEYGVIPWREVAAFALDHAFIPSTSGFPLFTDSTTVADVHRWWDTFMQDVETARLHCADQLKFAREKIAAITGRDAESKRLREGWQRLHDALTAYPEGLEIEAQEKFQLAQQHLDERISTQARQAGVTEPESVAETIMEILSERSFLEEYHAHSIGQLVQDYIADALQVAVPTTEAPPIPEPVASESAPEAELPAEPLPPPPAPPAPVVHVAPATPQIPLWKRMLYQIGYKIPAEAPGSAQPAHV